MLVTAGQDDVVKVWDLCDGEEIGQLRGHRGESRSDVMGQWLTVIQGLSKPCRSKILYV